MGVLRLARLERSKHGEANMIATAYNATHDTVTDLPNHFLFLDRLDRAVVTSERNTNRFALLYIVLENHLGLKKEYGERVYNQLITQLADRLKISFREADTLARTEDNRFAVLLTQIQNKNVVNQLIRRVEETLLKPYQIDSMQLYIKVNIARGIYPDNGVDAEMLIQYVEAVLNTV